MRTEALDTNMRRLATERIDGIIEAAGRSREEAHVLLLNAIENAVDYASKELVTHVEGMIQKSFEIGYLNRQATAREEAYRAWLSTFTEKVP